jgi:Tfp pilus assembly protein PilF
MNTPLIANLEKLIGGGRDNALLRFSLGNEYLKQENYHAAVLHLRKAVDLDAHYSAAWKLLGRALSGQGESVAALEVYRQGIAAAEEKGDKQAAKEMAVFARRIENALNNK